MDSATMEREDAKAPEREDDGLGDGSGIPGGAQPGDDGYDEIAAAREAKAKADTEAGDGGEPPTPPASLPADHGDGGDGDAEAAGPSEQIEMLADRELGLKVGGRKPESNVLKLKGGKIDLGKSQFNREDRFLAVMTLQVTGDATDDTINRITGEVKSTAAAQKATVCGSARIEQYLTDKIESVDLRKEVFEALGLVWPSEEAAA